MKANGMAARSSVLIAKINIHSMPGEQRSKGRHGGISDVVRIGEQLERVLFGRAEKIAELPSNRGREHHGESFEAAATNGFAHSGVVRKSILPTSR